MARLLPAPLAAIAAAALLFAPVRAAHAAPALAWPDTDPARHARAYFEAFGAGEDAMRAFWTTHGSAAALAQRPVEPRLDVWRDLRDQFESLEPLEVTASAADRITVRARTGRGALVAITFPCDAEPPHGLIALRVEDAGEAGAAPPPPSAPPAAAGPPPTEAQLVAMLKTRADSLAAADAFSGAYVLDRDGETLAGGASGFASRAAKRANALETRFNLGSINKIFTTVAIRQLAQQGKLSLDDPVTKYLPDYRVANADRITLGMLLEHRGGVPDMLESDATWKHPEALTSAAAWYATVRELPLRFEPGTRQEYSNGGFVLLGMVVERASGEDYYDYVAKHVYAPAGMTATGHFPRAAKSPERAECYTAHHADADDTSGPGPWPCTDHGLARGSSAGGGWSTAGDLVRFARALRAGRLLDAANTRALIGASSQLAIAGGSPGVNALLVLAGPYTFVVLENLDPPAAEQFGRPVARALRQLTGAPEPRPLGGPRTP